MGIDDVLRQMEEDDRSDRVAEQTLASPIDYARSRGIAPQKVYKSLRDKRLEWAHCGCGRKVIVIDEADELYGFKEVNDDIHTEQTTDSGSDQVS